MVNSIEGDEPFLISEEFKGKSDRYEIPSAFLDQSPKFLSSALSFFSLEAFRFYLPAYLIASLNKELERADVIFHLTHCFTNSQMDKKVNSKRYGEKTWFDYGKYQMSVFDKAQIESIVAFLNFKMDDKEMFDFEKEPIIGALNNYWSKRLK